MTNDKLTSLIHYIIWKCKSDPSKLGSTKLNKILWYSDILTYRDNGEAITNTRYHKLQHGPAPEFTSLKNAFHALEVNNDIVSYENEISLGRIQKQFIAKSKPDISCFSSKEISLVDNVIDNIINNHTTQSISDETHDNFWWDSLNINEKIPNYCIFAQPAEITSEDISWAENQL